MRRNNFLLRDQRAGRCRVKNSIVLSLGTEFDKIKTPIWTFFFSETSIQMPISVGVSRLFLFGTICANANTIKTQSLWTHSLFSCHSNAAISCFHLTRCIKDDIGSTPCRLHGDAAEGNSNEVKKPMPARLASWDTTEFECQTLFLRSFSRLLELSQREA
jgi:hypothetical protein